jgi:hypothetical protein
MWRAYDNLDPPYNRLKSARRVSVSFMEYDIKLVNVEKEEAVRKHWATVAYKFSISNGSANTYGDVVLTEGGVNIIEKNGRDPQTAAKVALERFLRQLREPFETQIVLRIPYGHAEYFSRYGNYETLPTLTNTS